MNPNQKVFAALRVNGIVTDWESMALKHIPLKFGRFILESEMDGREFSSLELRLSRREIKWESQNKVEAGLAENLPIRQVAGTEPIDEIGDITYNEIAELSDDSVWTQYLAISRNSPAAADFGHKEREIITNRWNAKYADTKFIRLIGD